MQSRRLIVELEQDNPQLAGWVTDPDGRRQRFDGWLALASRFAELHEGHPIGGPGDRPNNVSLDDLPDDWKSAK